MTTQAQTSLSYSPPTDGSTYTIQRPQTLRHFAPTIMWQLYAINRHTFSILISFGTRLNIAQISL